VRETTEGSCKATRHRGNFNPTRTEHMSRVFGTLTTALDAVQLVPQLASPHTPTYPGNCQRILRLAPCNGIQCMPASSHTAAQVHAIIHGGYLPRGSEPPTPAMEAGFKDTLALLEWSQTASLEKGQSRHWESLVNWGMDHRGSVNLKSTTRRCQGEEIECLQSSCKYIQDGSASSGPYHRDLECQAG
jgi:hypothetical protein